MKKLWNVLAVIAIANVLAVGAFVGWLFATGRLDGERVTALRATISKPIPAEKQEQEKHAAEVAAAVKAAEAEARMSKAPLTAEQQLEARLDATDIDRQKAERLGREVADLRAQLGLERTRLEQERAALVADRAAFEAQVTSTLASANDEQMKKTLSVLTALPPESAVAVLRTMMEPADAAFAPVEPGPVANGAPMTAPATSPASSEGMRTVVGYLDAMKAASRNKILAKFAEADPALATRLLNELRTRAEFVRVP